MSVRLAHLDECEPSGHWRFVRRTLGVNPFGVNLVDIPPGEQIPEHDETEHDHEEGFYVVSGSPTLVVDGEDHPARAGMFARLDRQHRRTVRNATTRGTPTTWSASARCTRPTWSSRTTRRASEPRARKRSTTSRAS